MKVRAVPGSNVARRSEGDFRTLAGNLPDIIARLDRDLFFIYANGAAEHALGRGTKGIGGRRAHELGWPPDWLETIATAVHKAFDDRSERRFELRRDDSATPSRDLVGRVIPEAPDGRRVTSVLLIAGDAGASWREESERAEHLARQRNERSSSESDAFVRDRFLAIISHELRSPLNGVKSWAHVLENHVRDSGDETLQRAVAGILIGVDQQVRLIDDLLDMTRALSGKLTLARQPTPLGPLLAGSVEEAREAAAARQIVLSTQYRVDGCEVHCDAHRVRQIFANLLSNAIKFTPAGGYVHVVADSEGAMARITVRDSGAGVAPDFLPYLFDPFRQADQAQSSRRRDGMGLGLALVQRLAELHGGYATCESEGPGKGATFRVYLPLLRASIAHDSGERETPRIPPTVPSLDGIHVLLIDDQREARESVATLLRQAGAAVFVAASGREALAHLDSAAPGEDEVIVCDIAMPDEDGYATLRRIRAWESMHSRGHRPAIALSAFTQREDRMRALTEGFQMHLTKPVAPAELAVVVANAARGMRV